MTSAAIEPAEVFQAIACRNSANRRSVSPERANRATLESRPTALFEGPCKGNG
ncbi:MAG: hypothetical protein HC865_05005 [Cyanobacteria bacterium RU_5_0]|nr:hypothetical protein [Cyanobacteria bacterium RU_5_0]